METVPASTVHAFYRRWYRPENMAVIIAGDFDPAAVKQLIEAAMSNCHWPSVASPTPIPECALPSMPYPNDPLSTLSLASSVQPAFLQKRAQAPDACSQMLLFLRCGSSGHTNAEVPLQLGRVWYNRFIRRGYSPLLASRQQTALAWRDALLTSQELSDDVNG